MTEETPSAETDSNLTSAVVRQQTITWYLTLLLIAMVACMPGAMCSLYYLSTVPDVAWTRGREGLTVDRIWMARARRGPVGLGYETQRITDTLADEALCVTTTVRYLLWSSAGSDAEGATYQHKFTQTDYGWQSTGESCN